MDHRRTSVTITGPVLSLNLVEERLFAWISHSRPSLSKIGVQEQLPHLTMHQPLEVTFAHSQFIDGGCYKLERFTITITSSFYSSCSAHFCFPNNEQICTTTCDGLIILAWMHWLICWSIKKPGCAAGRWARQNKSRDSWTLFCIWVQYLVNRLGLWPFICKTWTIIQLYIVIQLSE